MDLIYNNPQQRNAFAAGAVSVSILWWFSSFFGRRKNHNDVHSHNQARNDDDSLLKNERDAFKHGEHDDDKDGNCSEEDEKESQEDMEYREMIKKALRLKSTEVAFQIIYKIVNETKRFGSRNLPSKMMMRERWDWESVRKPQNENLKDPSAKTDVIDRPMKSQKHREEEEQKNDTCIGSIFGLDVGGTLSKLLYFEEKTNDSQILAMNYEASSPTSFENSSLLEVKKKKNKFNSKSEYYVNTPRFVDKIRAEVVMEDQDHEQDDSSSSCNDDDINITDCVDPQFLDTPSKVKQSLNSTKMTRQALNGLTLTSKEEERQQALERFYAFTRQLDTYGSDLKDKSRSFYSRTLGGEFHFIQFETRYISHAMDLIKVSNLHLDITNVGATGGGAHKYAERWDEQLGIIIDKQDELDSLVAGMQFILADVVGECYTFLPSKNITNETKKELTDSQSPTNSNKSLLNPKEGTCKNHSGNKYKKVPSLDQYWWSRKVKRDFIINNDSYPYLLVMIGTGVSVLRVDGPGKHERISGSTIGGGTYWGLCRLLTDAESFDSVLGLAERGDPSKVDMMVGDIYGENSDALDKLGLTADIVASSFGKLVAKQHPARGLNQDDLARALLLMVTNNIGQVAYLNAKLYNTKRIFFVGNFLRQNTLSQKRLSYAINYWSQGKMEALFLEHEGYFGALGAFLLHNKIPQPQKNDITKDVKDGYNRKRSDSY